MESRRTKQQTTSLCLFVVLCLYLSAADIGLHHVQVWRTKQMASKTTQLHNGEADKHPMCDQCEENAAAVFCVDCGRHFCDTCEPLLHKPQRKRLHTRIPVDTLSATDSSVGGSEMDDTSIVVESPELAGAFPSLQWQRGSEPALTMIPSLLTHQLLTTHEPVSHLQARGGRLVHSSAGS